MTMDEDELMATTTDEEVPVTAVWNVERHRMLLSVAENDRWFESSAQ